MVESDFNRILGHSFSLISHSRLSKISDGKGGAMVKNPFDFWGFYQGYPIYCESKLIKGVKAFNLSRIEDHQYENLSFAHESLSYTGTKHYCLVPVCFYSPREMKRVLFFDFSFVEAEHNKGTVSFKQKELIKWMEAGLFLDIKSHKYLDGDKEKRREIVENLEGLDKIIIKGYI